MSLELIVTLVAVFISIALAAGSMASMLLARNAPEVKRLRRAGMAGLGAERLTMTEASVTPPVRRPLRKPANRSSQLQRRLAAADWDEPHIAWLYVAGQRVLPVLLGLLTVSLLGLRSGWLISLLAAIIGYMIPDLIVSQKIAQRNRAIQNGLPDALDLLVVCLEAGSSLDQAILRASDELEIAVPVMARELKAVATEIRAGKPRLEAFQDFSKRTSLEDVRALVTVLIQTDRFGTSIAQALRTHAETLRTKRRQRAEERAGKVGVKLVFPLVLCLLPALYVVCLGPVVARMYEAIGR